MVPVITTGKLRPMEQAIEVKKCVGPLHRGLFIAKAEFGLKQKVCRACKRVYSNKRYAAKKEQILAYGRAWKKANNEKLRAYNQQYRKLNPEKARASSAKYQTKLNVKLYKGVVRRVKHEIGITIRQADVSAWIGCSIPEWIVHLQSKFTPGMSWINYGRGKRVWEIDHYIPTCAFERTEEAIKEAMHFSNTRPLWSTENRLKGAKIPPLPLAA